MRCELRTPKGGHAPQCDPDWAVAKATAIAIPRSVRAPTAPPYATRRRLGPLTLAIVRVDQVER